MAEWLTCIPAAVLAKLPEIGPTAFALYVVLASHTDASGKCWPRQARLANMLGRCDRTVRDALRRLKSAGLVKQRKGQGADTYTLPHMIRQKSSSQNGNKHPAGWQETSSQSGSVLPPEQEPNNKIHRTGGLTRFTPPTVEQVRAYCEAHGNSIDAEKFVRKYEGTGWVDGNGRPIRSWQAMLRTWESNGRENSKASQPRKKLSRRKSTGCPNT